MTSVKRLSFIAIVGVVAVLLAGGCSFATRTTPHMGFGSFNVETQLSRSDIVVLDRVEGTSTTDSILFGIIQVIDGENWKVLGISFFDDKYTCVGLDHCVPMTETRAYYKALEATPKADAVMYKSMNRECSGIPVLWSTETVTFSGKAIMLKAD